MLIFVLALIALIAAAAFTVGSGLAVWKLLLIFLACFAAVNLLFFLFWGIVSLFSDRTKPIEKQNKLCRIGCGLIAQYICEYAGVRPVISGADKLPQDGRFLFVCNHRSLFDPLIVIDKLRKYNISFVSKPSNMEIPIAGRLSFGAGFLPIDRENDRNALRTILMAADYLKNDLCSVGIYPEGTRSKTSELLPFHAGSFKIAQKASVPIAVASIRGSEKVTENILRRNKPVCLHILEVIPVDTVKSMNTKALAAYVKDRIAADLEQGEQK